VYYHTWLLLLLSKSFPTPHMQRDKDVLPREHKECINLFYAVDPLAIAPKSKDGSEGRVEHFCLNVSNLMHW
jgi:hypothetical protein